MGLWRRGLRQPSVGRAAVLESLAVARRLGAFALDTRLFQGINIWIKPLKFHVALVVYLITLAVFVRFASTDITRRAWWLWHERAVVLAVVLEIIWIGAAAALGTGSHFNETTPLWASIDGLMGRPFLLSGASEQG